MANSCVRRGAMYSMNRASETQCQPKDKIIVQGIGILDAKSDMAILMFELENENSDPVVAEKQNQKMINFAEDYMKKYGIKEEDYSYARDELKPVYNKDGAITAYKASTNFRVKFYDINSITEFLYNIKGRHVIIKDITFTLQDPKSYYQVALQKAVQGANNTVLTISRELGVTYNPIPYYVEETSSSTLFYEEIYQSSTDQNNPQTGFITITANVLAKYEVTGVNPAAYTPKKPPKSASGSGSTGNGTTPNGTNVSSIQDQVASQAPTNFQENGS